mgnify:FL=1
MVSAKARALKLKGAKEGGAKQTKEAGARRSRATIIDKMSKDATRRLGLAKQAARAVLTSGGTAADAATAAQQFGTPTDGAETSDTDAGADADGSDGSGADEAEPPDRLADEALRKLSCR